ncbi:MAG: transcriptional regulator [Staphylococcus simulans]|uniref:transcriptional activator RinB n=1 Tax=Staphylococcus TaxID=1279 RepID=UPI0008A9746A|nr:MULTISPECIES: transcriptional regulator [Staphylococcus]MDK7927649.1 transcriptional regulator [Staphylococcus simulans]MDK8316315.1 transcriptional regulator [Staphylococcus simulans]OHR48126.1 transcriptional regulator [Staphylococcus sp. HMSC056D08]OHS49068.1 transcriptional regulator [Staphylococcus sp. HMSC65H10]
MIKTIFKIILTLTVYETAKYITEQLIIHATQNDDVEAPTDFNINDHIHPNNLKAEVSD